MLAAAQSLNGLKHYRTANKIVPHTLFVHHMSNREAHRVWICLHLPVTEHILQSVKVIECKLKGEYRKLRWRKRRLYLKKGCI